MKITTAAILRNAALLIENHWTSRAQALDKHGLLTAPNEDDAAQWDPAGAISRATYDAGIRQAAGAAASAEARLKLIEHLGLHVAGWTDRYEATTDAIATWNRGKSGAEAARALRGAADHVE